MWWIEPNWSVPYSTYPSKRVYIYTVGTYTQAYILYVPAVLHLTYRSHLDFFCISKTQTLCCSETFTNLKKTLIRWGMGRTVVWCHVIDNGAVDEAKSWHNLGFKDFLRVYWGRWNCLFRKCSFAFLLVLT